MNREAHELWFVGFFVASGSNAPSTGTGILVNAKMRHMVIIYQATARLSAILWKTFPRENMIILNNKLSRPEKILGGFAIIAGALTVPITMVALMSGMAMSELAPFTYALLGSGSALAGFYGLAGRAWAFRLLFVVYLVQCVEYHSETLSLSLIGPLSVKFGWGWSDPPSAVNINLLAVIVCCLAYYCAIQASERARKSATSPALSRTV